MTSDLFEAKTTQVDDKLPEGESYLGSLVGDGRQYKDPEALAQGAWHKDRHIAKIEAENAAIRAELEKRANSEDFVNKIMEKLGTREQPSTPDSQGRVEQPVTQQPDVASIARDIYNQEQRKSQELQNVELVRQKLQERYGNDFVSVLERKAQELKLTKDDVRWMSANRPDALLELVLPHQTRQPDNSHVPPQGQRMASGPSATTKTWKEYERLRVSDPKTYKSPEVQMQMMNDAVKLKEDFYK